LGKLIAVCSGEIEVIHLESMNEIFQDDIINTAVGILWAAGGLSCPVCGQQKWIYFAFGHHNVQSSKHLNSNKHW
jgi:hypothetical protein